MEPVDPRLNAFLGRCQALAARSGASMATLSTRIFNDGRRLKEIQDGGDVGINRLARAETALAQLEGAPPRSRKGPRRSAA